MREWESVLYSVLEPETSVGETLDDALAELNTSVTQFCERSGLSKSTVYKITSGHHENIRLNTFRRIVTELRRLEQGSEADENTIAVITNRESLEDIRGEVEVGGRSITLRGYPCSTVEEALKQSIIAERDGVDSIICGPITAYTVEDVVHTPVIGLDVSGDQVLDAIETAVNRL